MHIYCSGTYPTLDLLFPQQLQLLTITKGRIKPELLSGPLQLSELHLASIGSGRQLFDAVAALTNLRRLQLEEVDFGVCISNKGEKENYCNWLTNLNCFTVPRVGSDPAGPSYA